MRSRRILLTCHDAGGTVPPMLALAQALGDRGHQLVMLSQPSVRERAEAAGCHFTAFSAVSPHQGGKTIEEAVATAVPVITGERVGGRRPAVGPPHPGGSVRLG